MEFEQFVLNQRKIKLDKDRKFCNIYREKKRKMSLENGLSIVKDYQIDENSEIKVDAEKFRIRETPTLSTDADSRTDTNLKRLRDLSLKKKIKK